MRSFLLIFAALVFVVSAVAHPNLQDAMWVQFEPSLVRLAVNVSLKEISVAQGVPIQDSEGVSSRKLEQAAKKHGDYMLSHLTLSVGATSLVGKVAKFTSPAAMHDLDQTFYQYELEYPIIGPPPGEVTFSHEMLKEWPYAIGAAWDVSYVIRAKRSDSKNVSVWLLRFQKPVSIPTGWESAPGAAKAVNADRGRGFAEWLLLGIPLSVVLGGCLFLLRRIVPSCRRA